MDVELIHKPGRDNLVPDALSRREKLLTLRLLMLVEEDLDDVEKEFRDVVRETMKYDEDALTNNKFFEERGSKKNMPGGRRMRNLSERMGFITSSKLGCTSRMESFGSNCFMNCTNCC